MNARALSADVPRLLHAHGEWRFLYKPTGMHTAAGKRSPSLEEALPALSDQPLLLCNRLDCGTSGIVAAALGSHAVEQWRRAESAGLCVKRYAALLCGHMARPLTAAWALDACRRATTKILREPAPALRRTRFIPLLLLRAGDLGALPHASPWLEALRRVPADLPLTLAGCVIHMGARHQIRVHAARLGHPLWGDSRYGNKNESFNDDTFLLHHGALDAPGASVRCLCPRLNFFHKNHIEIIVKWLNAPS